MITIKVDEEFIQSLGSNSLIGKVVNENSYSSPTLVKLIFPQTIIGFKKQNRGPKELIVYEHNIPCLIKDILWLENNGYSIKIETPETEIK